MQLGTLHIDMILSKASSKQLGRLGKPYERGGVGRPLTSKPTIDLTTVKGPIVLLKQITLEAGETRRVQGISQIRGNQKRLHVIAEPIEQNSTTEVPKVVTVPTYSVYMPGSCRVSVIICNVTNDVLTLKKGRAIAKLTAANLIPNKMAPRYVGESKGKAFAKRGQVHVERSFDHKDRINKLMAKLDLDGMKEWDPKWQVKAVEIMCSYQDIFALEPMELGKTNLVKHVIRIDNPIPFKERYRRIPPTNSKKLGNICKKWRKSVP